jgi:hypothetical protein
MPLSPAAVKQMSVRQFLNRNRNLNLNRLKTAVKIKNRIKITTANVSLFTPTARASPIKLKSRVDFGRRFDSFHVPLYWNLDENAFAES